MPSHRSSAADVTVIGAGAVGASVAYELARRGASVLVLEAGATPAAGCSYANAGLIAPSHVEPLVTPSTLREGLGHLLNKDTPFYVSPRAQLVPFMASLARSAGPARTRLLTERLRELAVRSLSMHQEYSDRGLTGSFRRRGLMDVFLTENAFARKVAGLHRNPDGLAYEVLDAGHAREREPTLGAIAGGVLRPDEASCDSREFVASMLAAAQAEGAHIAWETSARRLVTQQDRVVAVETDTGAIRSDNFVVAAGMDSQALCASVGLHLPMRGGTGYVVDVAIDGPAPSIPLSVREPRVVATPYEDRLRMCGTLAFSESTSVLSSRRVQLIRDGVSRALPSLRVSETLETWVGQRPCTSDGVPAIGRTRRHRNLVVATGHAMWGLTLGPVTGELVAEGLLADSPVLHEAAFSPDRFRRFGPPRRAEPIDAGGLGAAGNGRRTRDGRPMTSSVH